jgi:hypothetical protein
MHAIVAGYPLRLKMPRLHAYRDPEEHFIDSTATLLKSA